MKLLRKLLLPFSILYWGITAIRNKLYDNGWLPSKAYDIPVICVGNLSTGGTGKSPMIEFLITSFKDQFNLAVLSRGYKRKTNGFREVLINSTTHEVGDEPLQFKRKFPDVKIAVCEDRQEGIEKLGKKFTLILLDDAFQHRKVRPLRSILLTTYDDLFVDDCILPVGNLRESKSGFKRADDIVVTKCPENLGIPEMEEIRRKINPNSGQDVFFSKIGYGNEIRNDAVSKPLHYLEGKIFTLVTGIANPKPLVEFLKSEGLKFQHLQFGDHHDFSISEISELDQQAILLTTEKDYMRLQPAITDAELFFLPITTQFFYDTAEKFVSRISSSIQKKIG